MFFLGVFGIHNFYVKKIKIGIIQFITLGGLGIWSLIDLIFNYEVENNIFPASFIVRINDQSKYEKVYEQILKVKNVKKVTKNDLTIKNTTMIVDNINGMFIFLIILIIINILCKIAIIISILKGNSRSGKNFSF